MLEHYINTEKASLWAHVRGVKDAAPIRQGDLNYLFRFTEDKRQRRVPDIQKYYLIPKW